MEAKNRDRIIQERSVAEYLVHSLEVNPRDIHRKFTWFLRMSYQQKHCQLGLNEREKGQNKRKLSDSQNSTGTKQVDKTVYLQMPTTLHAKGRMTLRVEPWAPRLEAWATENYSHALKPNGDCPVGFQNCLGLVTFFFVFL